MGGYFEIEFTIKFEISKKIKGDILDLDLVRFEWNIGKFYGSLLNHAQSIHSGIPTFDWGECPNKKYKTTFLTLVDGAEEIGWPVKVISDSWSTTYTGESPYELYLYPSEYFAETDIDGMSKRLLFAVTDSHQTISLDVIPPVVRGIVSDKETGEPIKDATVSFYKDDALVSTVSTTGSGSYQAKLRPGTYQVVCSATDYETETQSDFEVRRNCDLPFALEYIATGIVTGSVTDNVNGSPLDAVTVQAVLPNGTTRSTSTNSSGSYSLELPADREWELTFSKDAYTSATKTVTVPKYETVTLNAALEPAGDEREIYTRYLLNGGYRALLSSGTQTNPTKVYTVFEDFDKNGVMDLLLWAIFNNGSHTRTALYTIDKDTRQVIMVRDGKSSGIKDTGTWIYWEPDPYNGGYALVYEDVSRNPGKFASIQEIFVLDGSEYKTTDRYSWFSYSKLDTNTQYADEINAYQQGIHQMGNNSMMVYLINDEQVSQKAFFKYDFSLPTDHPSTAYEGTYDVPIRPAN